VVINLSDVRATFADIADLVPLSADSGQRIVLSGVKGEPIVLKLLKAGQDPSRTEREIDAVARLTSSRVPRILDHGKRAIAGANVLYVIEQRIDGPTLARVLQQQPKQDIRAVIKTGQDLLDACAEFESAKLVHRDLKPGNLIVDRAGKLWVIDFGIARMLDLPSLTMTSNQFGVFSLGYSAPEQIRNLKAQINSRADLFSVGVIMYEMLVGHNPYLAGAKDPLDILRRMLSLDLPIPAHPCDPNGELGLFISNMAGRFPSRRPQNTKEALDWYMDVRKELRI
jgi:serine/threonine-protein kinase